MDYLISLFAPTRLGTGGVQRDTFLGSIGRSFDYIPDSRILVLCLPGWGQKISGLQRLRKLASNSGASFLAYEFPRAVLSDDVECTKDMFYTISEIVRDDIAHLREEYSFDKCILIGVSLGCAMGSMIYKENPNVNEVCLIVPGENVARDVWEGCRTQHLRKSYERQGVTKQALEATWHDLAPEHNFPTKETSLHLYFGSRDAVIPFNLSYELHKTLVARGFKTLTSILPFGHYVVAALFLLFPKHFIKI